MISEAQKQLIKDNAKNAKALTKKNRKGLFMGLVAVDVQRPDISSTVRMIVDRTAGGYLYASEEEALTQAKLLLDRALGAAIQIPKTAPKPPEVASETGHEFDKGKEAEAPAPVSTSEDEEEEGLKLGDEVDVDGTRGTIVELDDTTAYIHCEDGNDVEVPRSELEGEEVEEALEVGGKLTVETEDGSEECTIIKIGTKYVYFVDSEGAEGRMTIEDASA